MSLEKLPLFQRQTNFGTDSSDGCSSPPAARGRDRHPSGDGMCCALLLPWWEPWGQCSINVVLNCIVEKVLRVEAGAG